VHVAIAGASGLIGPALVASLRGDGHDVVRLVRRAPETGDERQWGPSAGLLNPDTLVGIDAVVCLSGVGVGDHRWNELYKRRIVASRVDSVGTIAKTLTGLARDGAGP
jgi:uncharacterized protein